MNFLIKFFNKLTALILGAKRETNMIDEVKNFYPDAVVIRDIFPASDLNIEFVVLPSVQEEGVPENISHIIKRKDGFVTIVVTGDTAVAMIAMKDNPKGLAEILTGKLLNLTTIDEAVVNILDKITDAYNKIFTDKPLAEDALLKKLLGMVAALSQRSETFASVKELYSALLSAVIIDGQVRLAIPEKLEGKLSKLGLGKVAEKNEATALVVKLLEGQINNILEAALKKLKGDIVVV